MDPSEVSEGGGGGRGEEKEKGGKRKGFSILIRCGLTILLSIAVSFLFSFVFGLVAIAIGSFSSNPPVSLPALCRIVSSSVDIKSVKVCELGVLNYKAKHVFYPHAMGETRFRCHDDYYWASVFEVEYKEFFSGQTLHAVAEAPREALPLDCRPTFGIAWLTKMKFKVNETYNCRYTPGSHKADICADSLFNCRANDPSTVEIIRRFFVLFMRSSSFGKESSGRKMAYAVAGIVSGMLVAMCSIIIIRSFQVWVLALAKRWEARKHRVRAFAISLRRACLLVAYFSAASWLMLLYGKMIGLKQLSFGSNLGERTM